MIVDPDQLLYVHDRNLKLIICETRPHKHNTTVISLKNCFSFINKLKEIYVHVKLVVTCNVFFLQCRCQDCLDRFQNWGQNTGN